MSNFKTGFTLGVTKDQYHALTLRADGKSLEEIAIIIFDVTNENQGTDEEKMWKAINTLRKWFRDPKVVEAYKEIIKETIMPCLSKSLKRLGKQIDDSNGWLANKAANDMLTRYGNFVFDEDDKTIHIQVEGMPELGTPE